jgi:rhodanese-related sulfurtransferase
MLSFIFSLSSAFGQESELKEKLNFTSFSAGMFKDKCKPADVLLDVRSLEEYKEGHIKGAVLMSVEETDFSKKAQTLNKESNIFVYCAAGVRSKKASTLLSNMGFKNVYNLNGGYKDLVYVGMTSTK